MVEVNDWVAVRAQIAQIVADGEQPFSPATVAQAEGLVSMLETNMPAPMASKGYWATILLSWAKTLQIEIFADRLEVYRFDSDPMSIQHFDHIPGQPFSAEFMAAIS
jgi:hypothetical protein